MDFDSLSRRFVALRQRAIAGLLPTLHTHLSFYAGENSDVNLTADSLSRLGLALAVLGCGDCLGVRQAVCPNE